jgi:hypothetical protein
VLSECLGGLLSVDPRANLPLVAEFLDPGNPFACEAAAMALGKSRLPEALEALGDCWERSRSAELGRHVLLAIAILRRPAAMDFWRTSSRPRRSRTRSPPCRRWGSTRMTRA